MKRAIMLLALTMASLILVFAAGRKKKDDIAVKYDQFKDITLVMVSTRHNAAGETNYSVSDREFRFAYTCPGNDASCKPSDIIVACVFDTLVRPGWQLMDGSREIIFLADQERIAVNDVKWDGNTNSGSVYAIIENLTGTISPDQLRKLTGASEVAAKVGRFQFKIRKDEIEKWRELDAKVRGPEATAN